MYIDVLTNSYTCSIHRCTLHGFYVLDLVHKCTLWPYPCTWMYFMTLYLYMDVLFMVWLYSSPIWGGKSSSQSIASSSKRMTIWHSLSPLVAHSTLTKQINLSKLILIFLRQKLVCYAIPPPRSFLIQTRFTSSKPWTPSLSNFWSHPFLI